MGKYPLTYEEYEKKVIDLFLQPYTEDKQEIMVDRLDKFLKDDPNAIKGLYSQSCFCFDHPEIYGDACKNEFEDYLLESTPVQTLHMLLGGEFD